VGQTYYILVHAFYRSAGDFQLFIEAKNDLCKFAVPISIGDSLIGSNDGARAPFAGDIDSCGRTGLIGEGPSLFYTVTGQGTTLEASTCNPGTNSLDSKLHVFGSLCDIDDCIGGESIQNSCSTFQWFAEAGEDYYIMVHSFLPVTGGFELSLREIVP
jgi:hypothetical protein